MNAVEADDNSVGHSLSTMGAGAQLDIMSLQRDELMSRGLYPISGVMTYEEAHALYTQTF
ncbi:MULTISPECIES: hypothetical protein [Roseinatronobacter]|uniref:Uncharacterized protein n=1 Tax=Roseinatronobacter domitianus TaxID=2940293 RepID=A0ABT0M1Q4_9RHOB|nr:MULTISPECIES: hypothetical protein [Roseibaca]MCL1628792.1 hypothetical protein [Roseibaca domitiana]